MSFFLLDTNVLTEAWKRQPEPAVESWIASNEWFIPVPVIAEIQEGAEANASRTERARINGRLDAFLKEHELLVIWWDSETARTWGRLKHSAEVKRKPQALWDSLIEAMAIRHNAIVATRNTSDFRRAKTFDPFKGDSSKTQAPVAG